MWGHRSAPPSAPRPGRTDPGARLGAGMIPWHPRHPASAPHQPWSARRALVRPCASRVAPKRTNGGDEEHQRPNDSTAEATLGGSRRLRQGDERRIASGNRESTMNTRTRKPSRAILPALWPPEHPIDRTFLKGPVVLGCRWLFATQVPAESCTPVLGRPAASCQRGRKTWRLQ